MENKREGCIIIQHCNIINHHYLKNVLISKPTTAKLNEALELFKFSISKLTGGILILLRETKSLQQNSRKNNPSNKNCHVPFLQHDTELKGLAV